MGLRLRETVLASIVLTLTGGAGLGQVPSADYARSEGLRDAWMYLTRNLTDPPRWIGNTGEFVYRKTVSGGFSFVVMAVRTGMSSIAALPCSRSCV